MIRPDAIFVYARPQFRSTGLINNAAQAVSLLTDAGYIADHCALTDIGVWDTYLHAVQPRMVVLGAICVQPESLIALAGKFPGIIFLVRVHSNLPWLFQAQGQFRSALRVMDMARVTRNIRYSVVCQAEARRFRAAGLPVVCLPNVFNEQIRQRRRTRLCDDEWLHLSAMFAHRVFKHPAGHALTAAIVGQTRPVKLHVQGERADSPRLVDSLARLANLLKLRLPIEPYRNHNEFCTWLGKNIDVGLQLSMTESFNYVALEHLAQGIPCVTSRAVKFSPWRVDAEDSVGAARMVLEIVGNYPAASELALEAAGIAQRVQRESFLKAFLDLLEGG